MTPPGSALDFEYSNNKGVDGKARKAEGGRLDYWYRNENIRLAKQ
jgi:hypothetical protein